MKFIHTADIHLGAEPDAGSSYTAKRPEELWNSFDRLLNICEEEQTDLLLIAGDLFHRQPLLKELKELDISNLTPIDAMNTLYQLQNKLKNRW